jgi:hypothetical protein
MVHTPTVWEGTSSCSQGLSTRRRSADPLGLRAEAEELLRDLAFVLQATRSLKQALLEEHKAGTE